MKKTRKTLAFVATSILLVANVVFCPMMFSETLKQSMSDSIEQSNKQKQIATSGIVLELKDAGSPFISSHSSFADQNIYLSGRVVKIGEIYTKGHDLELMQNMLNGAVDAKVSVSCLNVYGAYATRNVSLKLPPPKNAPNLPPPMSYFDRVEASSSNPSGDHGLYSSTLSLRDGAVLQFMAYCTNLFKSYPYGYNKPGLPHFVKVCPDIANFFISVGRFDRLVEVKEFVSNQLEQNRGYATPEELKAAGETLEVLTPYLNQDERAAFQALIMDARKTADDDKNVTVGDKLHFWNDGPLFVVLPSKFSIHEKLLEEKYSAAKSQILLNQFEKAQISLTETLKKVDEELDSEEQILFERAMPRSRSDFLFLLSLVEMKLNKIDAATQSIKKTISIITDALGPDTPCLNRPLQLAKLIDMRNSQSITAETIATSLSEKCIDSKADSFLAYKAIQNEDFGKANEIIERMFKFENEKQKHLAPDIARFMGLSCMYAKHGQQKNAMVLLKKLNSFLSDDSLVLLRVYQLAEIALLEDDLNIGKNSHASWTELETALADAAAPNTVQFEKSDPHTSEINRQDRLRILGIAYLFNSEPEKAERIVEHGLSKHHAESVSERRAQIDYALCLLNLDRFDEAKLAIEKSFEFIRAEDGYVYPQNLVRVARKYQVIGKFDEAQKLLERSIVASKNAKNGPKDCYSAMELANLYVQTGQCDSAIAMFERTGDNPDATVLFRDWHLRYADVLLKKGNKTEAFKQCLAMLSNNIRESVEMVQALPPLIHFLDDGKKLTDEVVEKIVPHVIWFHVHPKDQKILLLKFADIARRQHVSEKSQKAVDHLLEQYGYSNVNDATSHQIKLNQHAKNEDTSNVISSLQRLLKTKEYCIQIRQMDHPGNLRDFLKFELLMKAQEFQATKEIILSSIRLRTELFREAGDRAILEKGLLVYFYAKRNEPENSLQAFKTLSTDLDSLYQMSKLINPIRGFGSYFHFPLEAAKELVAQKRFAAAEEIASRCMSIQKRWIGKNNLQKVDVLKTLSLIYQKTGRLEQAEDALKEAFDITCWNYGYFSEYSQTIRPDYAAILRLRGKNAEAELIANLKVESESPPAFFWDFGNGGRHSHSPPPEHFKDTAEVQLKEWLPKEISISGNLRSQQTLDYLVKFYSDRGKFSDAQKYLLQKLEIWNFVEGKCSANRSKVMVELARNALKMQNKKEAGVWLTRAEISDSLTPNIYDVPPRLISYADLYFELGNLDKANSLALLAWSMIEQSGSSAGPGAFQNLLKLQKIFLLNKNTAELSKVQSAIQKAEAFRKLHPMNSFD